MVYKASDFTGMTYDIHAITHEIDTQLKYKGIATWHIYKTFSHYPERIVTKAVNDIIQLYRDAGWTVERKTGSYENPAEYTEYWDYLFIVKE